MPFDYSHIIHNTNLMAKLFLANNPEQTEAVQKSLALSQRYLGCYIEEALLEGLRSKGFIIPDAATLQITLESYSKAFLGDKLVDMLMSGKVPTVPDVIVLTLEDFGIPITLEIESEIQNLQNDTKDGW